MGPAELSCPKGSVLKTEKESHTNIYHSKKMPWASRLIISERVLRGREGQGIRRQKRQKIEKKIKFGIESLPQAMSVPSKLTKRTASYLLLPEEKWDRIIRRIIKQHCTRGTRGISRVSWPEHTVALGLIT